MDPTHQPRATRSAGTLSVRIMLALAAIASAFVLTVTGAEPAGAASGITMTSQRFHDLQVHATLSVTLRSNGDVTYRIEAHNTARTRKFVVAWIAVESPAGNFYLSNRIVDSARIDPDTYETWEWSTFNAQVAARWDDIINDPDLVARFTYDAKRSA